MYDPPPAYTPTLTAKKKRDGKAAIGDLPIDVLHRIISLTLDPRSTPSHYGRYGAFEGDEQEERVRRLWSLFNDLRRVDRRFYLVSTSILRTHFLSDYTAHLPPNASSDPYPYTFQPNFLARSAPSGPQSQHNRHHQRSSLPTPNDPDSMPNLHLHRTRETAVFDRFIAYHLGFLLRSTESSLIEPSEDIPDLFKRLQPAARIEDLLLTLPSDLIVPSPEIVRRSLPLPQSHLSVTLTPGWVTLVVNSQRVDGIIKGKVSRETVLEVRREDRAEGVVRRIGEGLEDMRRGLVCWGDRIL